MNNHLQAIKPVYKTAAQKYPVVGVVSLAVVGGGALLYKGNSMRKEYIERRREERDYKEGLKIVAEMKERIKKNPESYRAAPVFPSQPAIKESS